MASSCCCAGGIAEIFMVDDHKERIMVKDRKGFIRLAVEEGVPIVPIYHFGNTLLFK
jgi:2-acylglycerol O-acyltransferase 2